MEPSEMAPSGLFLYYCRICSQQAAACCTLHTSASQHFYDEKCRARYLEIVRKGWNSRTGKSRLLRLSRACVFSRKIFAKGKFEIAALNNANIFA